MVHEQVQHLPVFLREPVDEAVDLRHPGLLILQLCKGDTRLIDHYIRGLSWAYTAPDTSRELLHPTPRHCRYSPLLPVSSIQLLPKEGTGLRAEAV